MISFAGDSPALSTGPRLALHAAASGSPTALVPEDPRVLDDRSLVTLRAAFTGAEPVGRGLPFTIGPNVKGPDSPKLVVSMVVFDGESTTLAASNTMNLLSISPDSVTADQLAQLALVAADGGSGLDGVVVVNPDPSDNTRGIIATDPLRLLPSEAPRDGAVSELVRLEALTTSQWLAGTYSESGALMDATMSDMDPGLGQMIGLRSLWAAIRRNRRVWLVTGLLGLIVGAGLPLVLPHKSLAVTDLYLAQTAGANPANAMADDVSLLQTNAVATQAVSAGHLDVSPSALLSHYSGLPLSDTILSIKFNGPSQSDAVAGARAVAQAFLAVQAKELRLQTDVLVHGLQSQISSLNTVIGNLNTQISSLSSASSTSSKTTNQITNLVNQRSADQSQVSQLSRRYSKPS